MQANEKLEVENLEMNFGLLDQHCWWPFQAPSRILSPVVGLIALSGKKRKKRLDEFDITVFWTFCFTSNFLSERKSFRLRMLISSSLVESLSGFAESNTAPHNRPPLWNFLSHLSKVHYIKRMYEFRRTVLQYSLQFSVGKRSTGDSQIFNLALSFWHESRAQITSSTVKVLMNFLVDVLLDLCSTKPFSAGGFIREILNWKA